MPTSKFTLAFFLLLTGFTSRAQFNTNSIINAGTGLGKNILGGMKDKKKQKNIQASLSEREIAGSTISVLRVREEDIISEGKAYINRIQHLLGDYYQQYSSHQHIDIAPYNDDINALKSVDKDWPTHYYEKELSLYKQYEQNLVKQEAHIKDSLATLARAQAQQRADSLALVKQLQADSLAYAERVDGFHFIAGEFALIKEQPSDKSLTMGKLHQGSYVRVIGYDEASSYLKVSFQDKEGWLPENALVETIDEINDTEANLAIYKSRQYYQYEPNQAYVAKQEQAYAAAAAREEKAYAAAEAKAERAAAKTTYRPATTYRLGPRGGCYYVTRGGTKVYVDKSNCR